jgi:predicted NBD/HSP70 family sugar kinase
VIIGTGTGGGVVVDGKVLVGPNSIAGEWGHNPLPWPRADELPGPPATAASKAASRPSCPAPGSPAITPSARGEELPAPEIAARAERETRWRWAPSLRYEDRMARALATVMNVLDPMSSSWAAACPTWPDLHQRPRAVGALRLLRHRRHPAGPRQARRLQRGARRRLALAGAAIGGLVIEVQDLCKTYRVHKRPPGFAAAVRSIFRRDFEEVRALDG